jgi:hypothetical protein
LVTFLVFNVSTNGKFIDTDGRDKISSAPESSWWKLFSFLFYPRTGFAFDYCYSIGDGIFGRDGKKDMNMFISDVPRVYFESFPFGYHLEYSFEFGFNIVIS